MSRVHMMMGLNVSRTKFEAYILDGVLGRLRWIPVLL